MASKHPHNQPVTTNSPLYKYAALGLGITIFCFLVYYFRTIVSYVLIAWVFSMLGQPVMKFFRQVRYKKAHIGPSMAAAIVIVLYSCFFILLGWIFIPPILEQAHNVSNIDYTAIAKTVEGPMANFTSRLQEFGLLEPGESLVVKVQHSIKNWIDPQRLGIYLESIVSFAGHLFVLVGSVVFIAFFFLKEEGMFVNFLATLVPQRFDHHIRETVDDCSLLLTRYFSGILIQIIVLSIFIGTILTVFGVKSAILIAVILSILNIIPYVGFYLGAALGLFMTMSANLDLDFYTQIVPILIKVGSIFFAAHLLDSFFLQPFIFSKRVLAHPLEIFLIILVGAQLGGIFGMLIAIPAYTVLRVLAKTFFNEYRFVQKLTDKLDEIDEYENRSHG